MSPACARLGAPVTASVNVCLEIREARTGRVIARQFAKNRAVDVGLTMIRDLIHGDTIAALSHCAVGTNTTATTATHTVLGAEVLRGAFVQKTKGTKSVTLRWVVGSQQANGNTLTEWGLFTAAVGGNMYARVVADPIVKTVAVSVLATWTLAWAADV
jgi:hypothetical protein